MTASNESDGETDLGVSGAGGAGDESGSVLMGYIADLYEADGDTSSLSSSPQSSTNNFGAFSTTDASSDDGESNAPAKPLPTSFSTSSLRDALDALENSNLQHPVRSPAPSPRGLLVHSRSGPNPAQLSPSERTPTAGAFAFPPKTAFVNDPEPSNSDLYRELAISASWPAVGPRR